jgi:hypothetical protein
MKSGQRGFFIVGLGRQLYTGSPEREIRTGDDVRRISRGMATYWKEKETVWGSGRLNSGYHQIIIGTALGLSINEQIIMCSTPLTLLTSVVGRILVRLQSDSSFPVICT